MKGDFSKQSFKPHKHYSSVRMQQGRVQLDADWNEQMDIFDQRLQLGAIDLVGQHGTPRQRAGFKIGVTADGRDLTIGVGRYYVNGWLCDNSQADASVTSLNYSQQPDYPLANDYKQAGPYLVYLDAWQRHVTSIEDSEIREVALGGADTTTRLQTVSQVKLLPIADFKPLHQLPEWQALTQAKSGRLRLELHTPRFANQLYRIEIHQGGSYEQATFKWSRDNAAIALAVDRTNYDDQLREVEVQVKRTKADEHIRFMSNNSFELSSRVRELRGEPGLMLNLQEINGSNFKFVALTADQVELFEHLRNETGLSLRVWNSKAMTMNQPDIMLDNGIKLFFEPGQTYHSGDYWLITTRAVENRLDWPMGPEGYQYCLPLGINHHYAPLAQIEWQGESFKLDSLQDCRTEFRPLSELSLQAIACAPITPEGVIYINERGYVGIDNSQPQAPLDVNGTIRLSNAEVPVSFSTAAFGAISPIFIRGTSAKNPAPALIKLGGKVLQVTERGLTLVILSETHAVLEQTTYDTASGNTEPFEQLSEKIMAMETGQVGILLSCDAWGWLVSQAGDDLRLILSKVGLERIGIVNNMQNDLPPYAAIFEKSPLITNSSCKTFEVIQTNDSLNLHAELTGLLLDGRFMINGNEK